MGARLVDMPANKAAMKMRALHGVLGALCLAFIALIVLGNTVMHTAPGGLAYFKRADVSAMLALAVVLAVALFWSAAGDTDRHRMIGSTAAGTMTGLFLGTLSLPVVAVPLAIVGWFRLPDARGARAASIVLTIIGVAFGVAVPAFGRFLNSA